MQIRRNTGLIVQAVSSGASRRHSEEASQQSAQGVNGELLQVATSPRRVTTTREKGFEFKWGGGGDDVCFVKSWIKFPEDYIINVKPMIG